MAIGKIKVILLIIKAFRIITEKGYAARTLVFFLFGLPFLICIYVGFGADEITYYVDSLFKDHAMNSNLVVGLLLVILSMIIRLILLVLYLISGIALLATPVAGIAGIYDYFMRH